MPDITLYTLPTANNAKISSLLELLNISYEYRFLDVSKMEHKEPWFLKICPNGRIPAIIDHRRNNFAVWESGAIMLYLAENYDTEGRYLPKDPKARSEVIQWIFFVNTGLALTLGQLSHFLNNAPEQVPYAIQRYSDEVTRLFKVLEDRLEGREYLVGNTLTIADINALPVVRTTVVVGFTLAPFPRLQAWTERVRADPQILKSLRPPSGEPDMIEQLEQDITKKEVIFGPSRKIIEQQFKQERILLAQYCNV